MNLKKTERYLRVNLLGPGPRLMKRTYRAAVSHTLRNTALEYIHSQYQLFKRDLFVRNSYVLHIDILPLIILTVSGNSMLVLVKSKC